MTLAAPTFDPSLVKQRKARARAWFESLRDDICAALETLEDDAPAALYGAAAGRFVRTPWSRTDHTGSPWSGICTRSQCSPRSLLR